MSCVVAKQCRLNSPMWSNAGTMHNPRDSHVSVLYRNKIYSFGGRILKDKMQEKVTF